MVRQASGNAQRRNLQFSRSLDDIMPGTGGCTYWAVPLADTDTNQSIY